jgi:two-component SAPR family response regulator
MKKKINVLVVEDSVYYNLILSNALQKSIHFLRKEPDYQLILQSFTDSRVCLMVIESAEFKENDIIAFVNYYAGNGITGTSIIEKLRKQNSRTRAIFLSQYEMVKEKTDLNNHDYFVVKDSLAPALCRLYLDQFIENKFS